MSDREQKRAQFDNQKGSGRKLLIPVLALLAIAVAAAIAWTLVQPLSAGATVVEARADGTIRFSNADFADGKARFYRYQGPSETIDFFLVKSRDGVIRAAFDSCDVCYKEGKGYRQEGHDMVCNNCDQHFRADLVNVVKGGCNPAPLLRQQQGSEVVITVADLQQGARYFTARN